MKYVKKEKYEYYVGLNNKSNLLYIVQSGGNGGKDEPIVKILLNYLLQFGTVININYLNWNLVEFDIDSFGYAIENVIVSSCLDKKQAIFVGHSLSCYFFASYCVHKNMSNQCIFFDPTPVEIMDNLDKFNFKDTEYSFVSSEDINFKISKKLLLPIKNKTIDYSLYDRKSFSVVLSSDFITDDIKKDKNYYLQKNEMILNVLDHSFTGIKNEDLNKVFFGA